MVIGNVLHTRKERVLLVDNQSEQEICLSNAQKNEKIEIEKLIVERLVDLHQKMIHAVGDNKKAQQMLRFLILN